MSADAGAAAVSGAVEARLREAYEDGVGVVRFLLSQQEEMHRARVSFLEDEIVRLRMALSDHPEPPHPSLPRILPSMTPAEALAEFKRLEAEADAAFAEMKAAMARMTEGEAALAGIKARGAGR